MSCHEHNILTCFITVGILVVLHVTFNDVVPDEGVYTYSCRCGGAFCISEDETQRKETGDEMQETEDDEHKAAVVCCDTCSLSVNVTWSSQKRTHE